MGPIGSKVTFMFPGRRSLGRSSPNLVGKLRAAPDISSRGSRLRSKVKFLYLGSPLSDLHETYVFFPIGHVFFCLFPYFSQVLGPILKVKVIEVKGQISVSPQSLVRFV